MKDGLTILVFAYNEEKFIIKTLNLILDCINKTKLKFEIIILNDGSKDKTEYLVKKEFYKNKNIKIFNFKQNQGLTKILKYGVNKSKFKKLTWFPGDDSFLKKNLVSFFKKSKNFDLVNGYRANREVFNLKRNFLSSLNQFSQSLLFRQEIKDVHGIFIFKTKDLKNLKYFCRGYSLMVEILPALLLRKYYKISYTPIFLNKKTIGLSGTFSFPTIIDFMITWCKSFYKFKILNHK